MTTDLVRSLFFERHPDPMWISDMKTMAFLDVNASAIAKYGYSREEFLSMTIADIHPGADVPALEATLDTVGKGRDEAGIWRHQLKSGEVIAVEITTFDLDYEGRDARMVTARDVTASVMLEKRRIELVEHETRARAAAEKVAGQFRQFFQAVPGKFLVIEPVTFEIVAASDAYLQATLQDRDEIVGKYLFDVFPDDPDDPDAKGKDRITRSLRRVIETGQSDVMDILRYPIPRSAEPGAGFEERYWSCINTPILDENGVIAYIVHRTEDVTEAVNRTSEPGQVPHARVQSVSGFQEELLVRADQIRQTNSALAEQLANLKAVRQLLGVGTWRLYLSNRYLEWSEDVFRLLGISKADFDGTLESYTRLVHPEDREQMLAGFRSFLASNSDQLQFSHRVVSRDGTVRTVRGVGERAGTEQAPILTGVVQDITQLVEEQNRLRQANAFAQMAGYVAGLGAWRVDLETGRMTWSEQTANIHGMRGVEELSIEDGIAFYAPEYREKIKEVFGRCVRHGISYDENLQIVRSDGRKVWVRTIGQAVRNGNGDIIAVQGAFQDISDLVRVHEEREQLGARLHHTLENISDAFLTMDHDWTFTFLNGQAEKLLQRKRETLIGRNAWKEFPEAAERGFLSYYQQAVDERKTIRFTEYFDPLEIWFQVSAYPIPEGLAVYFRDVTAERETQSQLQLLTTAVSRMNDAVLITRADPLDAPDGPEIIFVNEAFERHTGYAADEVLGKTPRLLQGAQTQRGELDRLREAFEVQRPVRVELVNYKKNGEKFWVELDITPIRDGQGKLTHFVSVQRDITERKQAAEQALIADERFRIVASATTDVIWDWDLETDTIWWSDGIERVFGYPYAETSRPSHNWSDNIHPEDRERVMRDTSAAIRGNDDYWSDEYRFLKADGSVALVLDKGFMMRDETGKASRMLGAMADLTERRQLDEMLAQAQKMETIGQLTGGISHDFNNLLTIVLGSAELLGDLVPHDSEAATYVRTIENAAERGAEMTSRLLAYARRQPLAPQSVDVNRLLGDMDSMLRRTIGEAIEIEIIRSGGLWTSLVDPMQLETALINLAINARDAMVDGGRLTIETANSWIGDDYAAENPGAKAGQYVLISVTDTGPGMSSEVIARAFEPFFTTKPTGKGSGLGLSMVYGFVKQSDGHIKIYSEVSHGTTIKLYLPRARHRAESIAGRVQTKATPTPGGHEHILVVEDDELVRHHVVHVLMGLGYTVMAASNGHDALAIIESDRQVDLLFTDVIMPSGMSGKDLADRALRLRPGLGILYTSGYTENSIVHHGRLDPGVELLSKPYRREDLARKMRKVLDRKAPRGNAPKS